MVYNLPTYSMVASVKRKQNGHCKLSAYGYISLYFIFNGRKSIYFQFFVLSLHFRHPFLSPSTNLHVCASSLALYFFPIFHGYDGGVGRSKRPMSKAIFVLTIYVTYFCVTFCVCAFFVSLFSFYDGSGYRISLTLTHTAHTLLSSTCRDENRKLNEGKTFALVRTFLFNFVPFSSRTPQRQRHRVVGVGRLREVKYEIKKKKKENNETSSLSHQIHEHQLNALLYVSPLLLLLSLL